MKRGSAKYGTGLHGEDFRVDFSRNKLEEEILDESLAVSSLEAVVSALESSST